MASFRDQLNAAYDKKVVKRLEKSVRAAALKIDSILVLTTPVDTGRARSNWLPSLNTPARGTVEPGDKPNVAAAIAAYKLADKIYISNNLPYIKRLNNGYSRQAPAGFVDAAIEAGKRAAKL